MMVGATTPASSFTSIDDLKNLGPDPAPRHASCATQHKPDTCEQKAKPGDKGTQASVLHSLSLAPRPHVPCSPVLRPSYPHAPFCAHAVHVHYKGELVKG